MARAEIDAPPLHEAGAVQLQRRQGFARLTGHDHLRLPVAVQIGDEGLILVARADRMRGEAGHLSGDVERARPCGDRRSARRPDAGGAPPPPSGEPSRDRSAAPTTWIQRLPWSAGELSASATRAPSRQPSALTTVPCAAVLRATRTTGRPPWASGASTGTRSSKTAAVKVKRPRIDRPKRRDADDRDAPRLGAVSQQAMRVPLRGVGSAPPPPASRRRRGRPA